MTKNISYIDIVIGYDNKLTASISSTKYLGIVIENSLSWKAHIVQLITKLCTACYAIRSIKPFIFLSQDNSIAYQIYIYERIEGAESKSKHKCKFFCIYIYIYIYICTVHLDTIKVYYSPTNAQAIVLKTILKFTLK
jgi:hypothetical protein